MFKRILVSTDGSECSLKAIQGAIDYAQHTRATLIAVSVIDSFNSVAMSELFAIANATLLQYARAFAEKNLAQFTTLASAAGVNYETELPVEAHPWAAILDLVKKRSCDAIFMASHGRRGAEALLLGSETQKILTHSTVPVLVYK